MTNTFNLITRNRIIADLAARNKHRLLHELSRRASEELGLDPEHIIDAILARERLGSTGVGMGTGIPHARLTDIEAPFGIFARLAHKIDYEAIDGASVDLVFFLLLPSGQDKQNLVLLADITKRLRMSEFRTKLRDARDADELFQVVAG